MSYQSDLFLNEAVSKSLSVDAVVKKIAKATDQNFHTESLKILAKEILKDAKMVKALDAIETISDYWGHLSEGAKRAREEFALVAMEKAKKILSPEDYDKVNGAF
jgi:hypothetical protein